jgi:predicted aspartyl protease
MGHTFAKVKFFDKEKKNQKDVDLLVDTGSTYSWVRRTILENLGVVPIKPRNFQTIEGKIIVRQIGEALVQYDGESATTIVVFGEENDKEAMGVVTMEELGLEVDPVTQKLKKSKALLAI